eukprot:CAMPEP_0204559972 /NCGR_PEP_ID=MMETSP0661-20131031/32341_1 /ASSEMBLY_ACC=CAM_ASM_000606 /TAXON_ID=109239 /ORGANISM="Alexandrium margalefi, Strain AMGDE01CS-322" /LENGTH=75 /DNA_ID=CAMNT_0051567251 /DNA_START=67 /DNA_END=290 /DNA_ORIENTATION=-
MPSSSAPALLGLLFLAFCGGRPAVALEQGTFAASGSRLALLAAIARSSSAEDAAAEGAAQAAAEGAAQMGAEEGA